jgi:hypothetical protein
VVFLHLIYEILNQILKKVNNETEKRNQRKNKAMYFTFSLVLKTWVEIANLQNQMMEIEHQFFELKKSITS